MASVRKNKHYLFLAIFLFCWLPIVFVSTVLVGLVYVTVQQSYRQGANDPQIQLAQDSANALTFGTQLPYVSDTSLINAQNSLSPFRIIYDEKGNVEDSQIQINKSTPKLPSGVLTDPLKMSEKRFTWEPLSNLRFATVVVPYHNANKSGYVLIGRSLLEVEQREANLFKMCAIAYMILLVGSFLLVFLLAKVLSKRQP